MPQKIALDYDDKELRVVVAQCSGSRVHVSDARAISIDESSSPSQALRGFITENSLQKTDVLVAVGRGKAELRELRLPIVPPEELPDMVRFQAIRSFASASDRAIVDFLETGRDSEISLIAAAMSPSDLDQLRQLCQTSELSLQRAALRPLTAAPLYLKAKGSVPICVLIDLLTDDAEITVARDGKVIFVRTVRLPQEDEHRSNAIAAEIKRTLMACGETNQADRIIVWGTQQVHQADLDAIRASSSCQDVQAVNPFDLVDLKMPAEQVPAHVGRLAPLVGLLVADEGSPQCLIDFLNPRERPEEKPDHVRRAGLIGGPIAAVVLVGALIMLQLRSLDQQIATAETTAKGLATKADEAQQRVAQTEEVDVFLDEDVHWLDEFKNIAANVPPSDKLIVNSVIGTSTAKGGGTIKFAGAVVSPDVIESMESALREADYQLQSGSSNKLPRATRYTWSFDETITIPASAVRQAREERLAAMKAAENGDADTDDNAGELEPTEQGSPATDSSPDSEEPATSEPENTTQPATADDTADSAASEEDSTPADDDATGDQDSAASSESAEATEDEQTKAADESSESTASDAGESTSEGDASTATDQAATSNTSPQDTDAETTASQEQDQ